MYSNSLVGDPKNRLSTMWLLCGDTNRSHAPSRRAPSACGTRPTLRTTSSRPVGADGLVHQRLEVPVADEEHADPRVPGADGRQRRGEHVDAVPAAERAGEADDDVIVGPAERLAAGPRVPPATAGA